MTKPLETIMQREMSRKEFLATVGFGIAGIMGFSSIIKLLTNKSGLHHQQTNSMGYGSSAYGGNKD